MTVSDGVGESDAGVPTEGVGDGERVASDVRVALAVRDGLAATDRLAVCDTEGTTYEYDRTTVPEAAPPPAACATRKIHRLVTLVSVSVDANEHAGASLLTATHGYAPAPTTAAAVGQL